VGKETLRLATTAGSEVCSLLLESLAWDSKGQSYRRQQVLKSCDCQQAVFLERNLGIGEKGWLNTSAAPIRETKPIVTPAPYAPTAPD